MKDATTNIFTSITSCRVVFAYCTLSLFVVYASMKHSTYAIRCYENAVSVDTEDGQIFYYLAVMFQRRGDLKNAMLYTKKAVKSSVEMTITNTGGEGENIRSLSNKLLSFLQAATCEWASQTSQSTTIAMEQFRGPLIQDLTHKVDCPHDSTDDHAPLLRPKKKKIKICYILPTSIDCRLWHIPIMHKQEKN